MNSYSIDHLVITSGTLRSGVEFVEDALRVRMQPGGQHVRMGTHNALLKIGPDLYLEVIAIDPELPKPRRPRWFHLDSVSTETSPRLATWVVRTKSLPDAESLLTVSPGKAEFMERGDLSWMITIPADGLMPLGGAFPSLIQWNCEDHPTNHLADCRITLSQLHIQCDRSDALTENLLRMGLNERVIVKGIAPGAAAALTAVLETTAGTRTLS